jgi:ABC-2 type transport system permease protein
MASILLLLRKDLRVLRRSPLVLLLLLAYPLVIALLVGLVAAYASAKPRVALVDEDGLPETLVLAGHRFHLDRTIDRVRDEVELVRLSAEEAERQLETGKVVASLTVPEGFVRELRLMARSPRVLLETTQGGLAPRVRQQVQALVYSLNRELQTAYIETNVGYIEAIRDGGSVSFLGREYDVLGLEGTRRLLDELPAGPRLDEVREFVRVADVALDQTDEALRATASPIELVEEEQRGRTWALSAQVQAYGLALTIAFLALVLAAGALAGERDEGVLGRLRRGLVAPGQLVAAKVGLAAAVALALGLAIALAFGVAVEVGDVVGGEPWGRLPLLAVGLALAGASLGALGTLLGAVAGEARAAVLVALLVVLPLVFLGLIPREVVPPAGLASDAMPFAHAVRFFAAALYETDPWGEVAREAAWLGGLGLVFGLIARQRARRLGA